ncbi:transferases, transferring glycosyl groups [Actinidia rufa]|uniref:Transferases, transferring glycosyl groups n=1 Tax=Actinidia rufa TaxID=165716 RepID=A0A7J0GB87_9ERIC|nr:transferases, transferring glycosyl groups [Actinidia rufa]
MNSTGNLQVVDLWYDWPNGRNFNIIQAQLGKLKYDLEWNNGTSYIYTLDSDKECRVLHFEVGILRPDWLDGANYLGQRYMDGFLCNVWEKVDFIWYYEDVETKRPVYWEFYTGSE